MSDQRGQALLLTVGLLAAALIGALVLGGVARGIGARNDAQGAADLGALAAARKMREVYPRLFVPVLVGGRPNPTHLSRAAYLEHARRAAIETARRNGARDVAVDFPEASAIAPIRVRVSVRDGIRVGGEVTLPQVSSGEAELVLAGSGAPVPPDAGEYPGQFATRQGERMRPDVARAFDRMAAAARVDGVGLIVVSGFRSDREQAALFAANPDPRLVARPGESLHRLGTELDLGPKSAYGWLEANARRFHFVQRYSWEPWHYGYVLNPASASLGYLYGGRRRGDGEAGGAIPDFVPERYAPAISRASQRWGVSAALLAAQIWQESKFNPFAVSKMGAAGIAQFMPVTGRAYGLSEAQRFDPDAAIDAQAHLMRDLLRQFGSVALALAAYNAGPRRVQVCGCVPRIPETLAYVAEILGLLRGAGASAGAGADGLLVRLVS